MIVRSLLVTLFFLVALGLTGYLFLQHPAAPRRGSAASAVPGLLTRRRAPQQQ